MVTNNANKTRALQQLFFLSSWRSNKYPPMIDSAFIQEPVHTVCDRFIDQVGE
ncbi:hypothetical protein [Gilliamella sp. ESL0250]|uniref:hypothetical protein n=1 Tax=Gilliamella sp. ESL0250 TaxID=2705036 RepID=UPI0015806984|nr:hypothetical protein [Gilliamella sp. ESL0250]NUF50545.1 hypothetical protein [Gilliamella sp. ESL0250]